MIRASRLRAAVQQSSCAQSHCGPPKQVSTGQAKSISMADDLAAFHPFPSLPFHPVPSPTPHFLPFRPIELEWAWLPIPQRS
ncbi:hypothetical protein RRG08_035759 [Elysia crispata]|uniref:Uncharacterized protein n=1 Tax=Elysia crispata TaxID=231223 RepID=A0AAE1DJH8_9GAST|nr:hypothetical protein RRG08_035759 [Elysia crispata]